MGGPADEELEELVPTADAEDDPEERLLDADAEVYATGVLTEGLAELEELTPGGYV